MAIGSVNIKQESPVDPYLKEAGHLNTKKNQIPAPAQTEADAKVKLSETAQKAIAGQEQPTQTAPAKSAKVQDVQKSIEAVQNSQPAPPSVNTYDAYGAKQATSVGAQINKIV